MVNAEFQAYGSYTTDSVAQWDLNQQLTVTGIQLDTAPLLVFSCRGMTDGIVAPSGMLDSVITADIPNAILQFGKDILVNICSQENGQYVSVERFTIPVVKRAMPANYLFTDNVPVSTYETLESLIKSETLRIDNLVTHEESSSAFSYMTLTKGSIIRNGAEDGSKAYAENFLFSDMETDISDRHPVVLYAHMEYAIQVTSKDSLGNVETIYKTQGKPCAAVACVTSNGILARCYNAEEVTDDIISAGINAVKFTVTVGYDSNFAENSEVIDIRQGYKSGTHYSSAGTHVRFVERDVDDLKARVEALENK